MKVNEYAKHLFLYSKGWYKKSDNIWEDLSKIIDNNLGFKCTEKEIILNKLIRCAFECIIEESFDRDHSIDQFQGFVLDLLPKNNWRFYAKANSCLGVEAIILEPEEVIVRKCLSIMSMQIIDNLDPVIDCDFNILPSSKDERWINNLNN